LITIGGVVRSQPASELVWQCGRSCDGGMCVEIARLSDAIMMRDSMYPDGTILTVSRDEWRRFVVGIKAGDFDNS
jgi:hypothetical protein